MNEINTLTLEEFKNDYDWKEAFAISPMSGVLGYTGSLEDYCIDDVKKIIAISNGQNDGESWIGAFQLNDGRYIFISAWCDYTGWGCQDGGNCYVASSLNKLIKLGITIEERQRLGFNKLKK